MIFLILTSRQAHRGRVAHRDRGVWGGVLLWRHRRDRSLFSGKSDNLWSTRGMILSFYGTNWSIIKQTVFSGDIIMQLRI